MVLYDGLDELSSHGIDRRSEKHETVKKLDAKCKRGSNQEWQLLLLLFRSKMLDVLRYATLHDQCHGSLFINDIPRTFVRITSLQSSDPSDCSVKCQRPTP